MDLNKVSHIATYELKQINESEFRQYSKYPLRDNGRNLYVSGEDTRHRICLWRCPNFTSRHKFPVHYGANEDCRIFFSDW